MATDINILIKATDQASPALKKVTGEIKDVGSQAKSTSSLMGGLGNVMKAGLTTALVGTAAAVGGLVFAFKDSLSAAKESIEAQKQLEQVIKSTGGAAGVTADQALDLASSLSQVTNFGDDAIVAGENLLLTFTGIGKDVFPRATETMLDMSQALGQDMKSSAVQLGKALNDPINGMTALSRVGVSFTDQQKEMITTMQEAGDVAGAQAVILDELAKEFGGSAKALADPATQLANAWGEVQEAVGMALVPVLNNLAQTVLPYVQAAAEAVSKAVSIFYNNLEGGRSILGSVSMAIYSLLPEGMKEKWLTLSADIQGSLNTITGNVQNAMGWIKLAWDTNWGDIRETWEKFAGDLPRQQEEFWKEWHKTFNTGSTQNANDWEGFLGGLSGGVSRYLGLIITNWTLTLRVWNSSWGAFAALFRGDWDKMWEETYTFWTSIMQEFIGFIEVFRPQFGAELTGAFTDALSDIQRVWQSFVTWWNSTVGAIPGVPSIGVSMPNFAVVNPVNVPGGGSGGGSGGFNGTSGTSGTVNHITVNTTGGYQSGVDAGDGIVDALRFRGH